MIYIPICKMRPNQSDRDQKKDEDVDQVVRKSHGKQKKNKRDEAKAKPKQGWNDVSARPLIKQELQSAPEEGEPTRGLF